MGAPGLTASCELRGVGTAVLMERYCPDCGVVLAAGHARCRQCFLRLEAEYQRKTERDWMRRNFPKHRPRDLFPEDYWEPAEIKNTSEKEVG